MNCELTTTMLHAYFDGELDALRAAEFERHLDDCAQCQSSLDAIKSLRTRLQEPDLYEHASPEFRANIAKQLRLRTSTQRATPPYFRPRFWVPAFAVLGTLAVFWLAFALGSSRQQSARLTAELVDAHVRSLQPGHLTDVQSTDQHTVKPWFDGRIDFIPPVKDYSEQGFSLIGGRLDVINGHDVAALVYARNKHLVNLFVWPAQINGVRTEASGARQGYNWIMWRSGEMQFCLVSDTAPESLRALQSLIH